MDFIEICKEGLNNMAGISFRHSGNFSKTERFFNFVLKRDYLNILDRYGQAGVSALASVTPKKTGKTAASWSYEIIRERGTTRLNFTNSNVNKGVNIAIILQYGHGTRNGGYVVGRDYINPAIQPIFDKIADDAWREVTEL